MEEIGAFDLSEYSEYSEYSDYSDCSEISAKIMNYLEMMHLLITVLQEYLRFVVYRCLCPINEDRITKSRLIILSTIGSTIP